MSAENTVKTKEKPTIPVELRTWFVIHCIVDLAVALPLFWAPETVLGLLGWETIDPAVSRLVAAALLGIGMESYLGRKAGFEVFYGMLNLKIIWSFFAVLGLLISLDGLTGTRNIVTMAVMLIFLGFNVVWVYWKYRLFQLKKSSAKL